MSRSIAMRFCVILKIQKTSHFQLGFKRLQTPLGLPPHHLGENIVDLSSQAVASSNLTPDLTSVEDLRFQII